MLRETMLEGTVLQGRRMICMVWHQKTLINARLGKSSRMVASATFVKTMLTSSAVFRYGSLFELICSPYVISRVTAVVNL